MTITKQDKIKNLRNGIAVGAIAAASMAPSPVQAQTVDAQNIARENFVAPSNNQVSENTLTLSPENFRQPGENALTKEQAREDIWANAQMIPWTEDYIKEPEELEERLSLSTYKMVFTNRESRQSTASADYFEHLKTAWSQQLSLLDYQSLCIGAAVSKTMGRLVLLAADGKTSEANKILPGFSKKYQDKIVVKEDHATISGDDYLKLKKEIQDNFEKIHPEFNRETQKFWQQNHNFDRPEAKLNDNLFVNILCCKHYDVTNPQYRQVASEIRGPNLEVALRLQKSRDREKQSQKEQSLSSSEKIKNLRQGKTGNETTSGENHLKNFKASWKALSNSIKELKNSGR